MSEACQQLVERCGGNVSSAVRSLAKIDTPFVELVGKSTRFGNAQLSSYADIVDERRALQFAAIQIDLPNAGAYVSFRGTDSTLVGWREDFMLSFCVTEAQREAAGYLERAVRRIAAQGGKAMVGGHSKGGVLAEYAALCCPDDLRGAISRVYSNDGPRMAPEIVNADSRRVLGAKFHQIVPTYSIVGMLFARADEGCTVVRSSGTGIGQHDPTTWQMTRNGVLPAPGLQQDCIVLNEAIARWAAGVPLDERAHVVNEVFDALAAGGATRFEEVASSPEGLQQVLRAFGATDARTREVATALVESTVSSSVEAVRRATADAIDSWRDGMRRLGGESPRLMLPGGEIKVSGRVLKSARDKARKRLL